MVISHPTAFLSNNMSYITTDLLLMETESVPKKSMQSTNDVELLPHYGGRGEITGDTLDDSV